MHAFVKAERAPAGEIRDVPEPRPKDDEVLVRVNASSICGTDLHIWEWNEWARARVRRVPMIFGHELSGEVVGVGARVRNLAVGDHVSAETHIVDGTCRECRTGRMHICQNVEVLGVDRDGVFAELVVLPEMNAWKNDPNLDPALASIQEPLGNAVHSLLPEEQLEDIAGASVLVAGCGPIGLLAIAVARTLGARQVLASEVNPFRAGLARTMGAELVVDPTLPGVDAAKVVREATAGSGVDVALEMSGHAGGLRLAFDALAPGGRVSLLGIFEGEIALNFDDAVIFKAARIHGIYGRRMFSTWYQVKGLLARPGFREQMAKVITHHLPMRDIPKAMDLMKSGESAKISLEPRW